MKVGTELPPLTVGPISRTTLALFAGASGDHNPIHIDLDVARSAGLDDVFVQGMLSMAYLGRLLTNWVPQGQIRSFTARFLASTPLYAQPICRGVVTSIDGGTATIEISVTLADGTPTLQGRALITLED